MKLFTIGPVQMYKRTLEQKAAQVPYFRNREFSDIMLGTDALLKKALGTARDTECVYLTASGTGAMEAAVINVFSKRDKLLVINGGTFGKRFADICKVHGIPHTEIPVGNGRTFDCGELEKYGGAGYTGLLVNLDETSTGQLYDINGIKSFCQRNGITLLVDAITSFLCDRFEMDNFGIDAAIVSSQKGLCSSPGISVVAINKKTYEERVEKNDPCSLYFDFKDYVRNMKRGQTPFTPAVGIIYEIHDLLTYIDEKGLDVHLNEISKRAEYFRKNIIRRGVRLPDYPLSNAITPLIFDEPVAELIYTRLYEEYGMVVNPSGGEMKERQLRVSHVGDLEIKDYAELIEAVAAILKEYTEK